MVSLIASVSLHVQYVVDEAVSVTTEELLAAVFASPLWVFTFAASAVLVGSIVEMSRRRQRTIPDVVAVQRALEGYRPVVPLLLRLSVGIPLVGGVLGGYYFTPVVPLSQMGAGPVVRTALIGIGFCIIVGVLVRPAALAGLGAYLLGLAGDPAFLLASEYLAGFTVLLLLGAGAPSASHVLETVATTEGSTLGRFAPLWRVRRLLDTLLAPWQPLVPVVIRVSFGVMLVYLGVTQKLLNPGLALAVVEHYDLTAVVPVTPAVWVVGVAFGEIVLGVALVAGVFTRVAAFATFGVLTVTLFGLPDDPALVHLSLFGLALVLLITGGRRTTLSPGVVVSSGSAPQPTLTD